MKKCWLTLQSITVIIIVIYSMLAASAMVYVILTVKISGTAGTMRYFGYTWRECIRRYNARAEEEKSERDASYGY